MEVDNKGFKPFDIVIFLIMLGVSALIGIYQALMARGSREVVKEYLTGGRNMSIFPISMSLIAR